MVVTRNGRYERVLRDTTNNISKNPKPSNSKKKRRSDEVSQVQNKKPKSNEATSTVEENKQIASRTLTPPPVDSSIEKKPHEKTPGRIGPIKTHIQDCKPDIKPFKGPKGAKVRKTFQEKEDEYAQFCLENEGHTFHELHVCYEKGPQGSPTYDKQGFQLSYDKVANWMHPKPYNKSAIMNGADRAIDQADKDRKRMAEIFFEKGEAPNMESSDNWQAAGFWKDRVSKDLNVPWHRVGVKEFEIWEEKGFKKAKRGEYQSFSGEEKARMMGLLEGASLRL